MSITRRNFIKGCTAATMLGLPALGTAAPDAADTRGTRARVHIEKSIKAGFGGGFSLRAHRQSGRFIYANIEHSGNHYTVASTDLFDWAIVSTS